MINSYPFFVVHDAMYQDRIDRSPQPPLRIDVQRHRLEHAKMHANAFDIDQQILALNAQRMRDIMRAEQLRLARGERASRAVAVIDSLRAVIASALIAAGERVQPARPQHGKQTTIRPA